jgi:mono/diheme cytochrome c family protein
VDRGQQEYETGVQCNRCHGPDGGGGYAATDTSWPAPPLTNEFARYTRTEIRRIVEQGRTGTPMPAWGIAFGGPLNDQRLDDVMNYLQSIQTGDKKKFELAETETDGRKIYETKCKDCHGPDARGQALGKPLPTFYAPDLTTAFYRLGLKVLQERLQAKDPALKVDDAKAQARAKPMNEILAAGEEAARSTIEKGRPNTPMPAWKNRIGPKQVDAVIGYLRTIQRPAT